MPVPTSSLSTLLGSPLPQDLPPIASASTILAALLSPATPLETLSSLRDSAEQASLRAADEPDRIAAVTVYFAACAAAEVHHSQRIAPYAEDYLLDTYSQLMGCLWVPLELAELFAKAQGRWTRVQGAVDPGARWYGNYRITRELHSGVHASVSAACARGDEAASRHALKLFRPLTWATSAGRARHAIHEFLQAAGLQQQIGEAGNGGWAKIHLIDEVAGGAYYVADRFDQSLRTLIRGQARVDAPGLTWVLGNITRSLMMLQNLYGRPHANLKPENVLLLGRGTLETKTVCLADPAGGMELEVAAGRIADLSAIGQMLYALVLQRAPAINRMIQVPATPHWTDLDPSNAERWRILCDGLLGTRWGVVDLALEQLWEELQALAPPTVAGRLRTW